MAIHSPEALKKFASERVLLEFKRKCGAGESGQPDRALRAGQARKKSSSLPSLTWLLFWIARQW
jgi:hypothetical protein